MESDVNATEGRETKKKKQSYGQVIQECFGQGWDGGCGGWLALGLGDSFHGSRVGSKTMESLQAGSFLTFFCSETLHIPLLRTVFPMNCGPVSHA